MEQFIRQLTTVRAQCDKCGQWVADSKLATHKRKCQGTRGNGVPTEAIVAIPTALSTGGPLFNPEFKAYCDSGNMKRKQAARMTNKAKKLVTYFERTVNGFIMDSLLYPASAGFPLLPSLELYLSDDQFINSDKKTAILAYKHVGIFLKRKFGIVYGSCSEVSLQDKTSWCDDVTQKCDLFDSDLNRLDRAEKQLTAAAAMADPANVTFQPARLAEIVRDILALEIFAKVKQDLLEKPKEFIVSTYTEVELRLALAAEVFFSTGGKRPSTIARIKNEEIGAGKKLADGSVDALVHDYKTAPSHGPSHVIFWREGLHKACLRYRDIFKKPEQPKRLLFSTEPRNKPEGGEMEFHNVLEWVKRQLPEGKATEEELKHFTARSNRKGFSNWGHNHPDQQIRRPLRNHRSFKLQSSGR